MQRTMSSRTRVSTMALLLVFAVFQPHYTQVHAQPWFTPLGNNLMNSFVPERPMSAAEASTMSLRWTLTNFSSFSTFSSPLVPNLQKPGDDLVLLLGNQATTCETTLPYGNKHQIPCTHAYVLAINGTTGAVAWITAQPASVYAGAYGAATAFFAGPTSVYVNDCGIKRDYNATGCALRVFDLATGKQRFHIATPWFGAYTGGGCPMVRESPVGVAYAICTLQVIAFNASSGDVAWRQNYPGTAGVNIGLLTESQQFSFLFDTALIVSYQAQPGNRATLAYNLTTGSILWRNPILLAKWIQSNPSISPVSDGHQIFDGSMRISALNGSNLTRAPKFPPYMDMIQYQTNMVAASDGTITVGLLSEMGPPFPTWSFTQRNYSTIYFMNGTNGDDHNSLSCSALYGVQHHILYGFSYDRLVAFKLPKPVHNFTKYNPYNPKVGVKSKAIWSTGHVVTNDCDSSPYGTPYSVMYLGSGRLLHVCNTNTQIRMYYTNRSTDSLIQNL